jgi:hypothetical protein
MYNEGGGGVGSAVFPNATVAPAAAAAAAAVGGDVLAASIPSRHASSVGIVWAFLTFICAFL